MRDNRDDLKNTHPVDTSSNGKGDVEKSYSLDDDRRVKVLSPGALVAKRFFRNRLAVLGLIMLAVMFIFSFVGGVITPYGQAEVFYTYEMQSHEYVAATENTEFRYAVADGQEMGGGLRAQFLLAEETGETEFDYRDVHYTVVEEGEEFYSIRSGDTMIGIAYKDIVNAPDGGTEPSFAVKYEALRAYTNGETAFTAEGEDYTLDDGGNILLGDTAVGYISRFVVQSAESGVVITADFRTRLQEALESDTSEFVYTGEDGVEHTYEITYDASKQVWSVLQETETYVYDRYASPPPPIPGH